MLKKPLTIAIVLLLLMTQALSIHVYAIDEIDKESLWNKYLDLYRRTAVLAKRGINVSSIVVELRTVLELIEKGDNDSLVKASNLLESIEEKVTKLEGEADNIVLMENLRKYSIVAAILSIPLLFYLLFPRLYLAIWFRARKRWTVEK